MGLDPAGEISDPEAEGEGKIKVGSRHQIYLPRFYLGRWPRTEMRQDKELSFDNILHLVPYFR